MSNHSQNTITITGPEAELRKFSTAHPLTRGNDGPPCDFMIAPDADGGRSIQKIADSPGHCFGWDVSRETIEEECEGRPGLTLTLKYHSTTAWGPPLDKVKELSCAYAELRFELEFSFAPGEGERGRYVLLAGKYRGRCCGEWYSGSRSCPDNGVDRDQAQIIYGYWWQFCEKHQTRWCLGDYWGRDKDDPEEQERIFNLLGGVDGLTEEDEDGCYSYAPGSYCDVDYADTRLWMATVAHRRRRLRITPEGRAMLNLSAEELVKLMDELAAEEAQRAKWAEEQKANPPPKTEDDLDFQF